MEWRDVVGFEGLYKVSSTGIVVSLPRTIKYKNGVTKRIKGKVLKQYISNSPYLKVCIYKNNKRHQLLVHRLVATAFIPNVNNHDTVNHKDFNTFNNNVDNLEWCDLYSNIKYSVKNGRYKRTKESLKKAQKTYIKKGRIVIAENIVTGEKIISPYPDYLKNYGFRSDCICGCLNGNRKTHKGYTFKYADETETPEEIERLKELWK